MKRLKKLASIILAAVMVFGMTIPTLAAQVPEATRYSITVETEKEGHTYHAYQIFKGDLFDKKENGVSSKVLSNIEWGEGIKDGDWLLNALKSDGRFNDTENANENIFKDCESASDVAEVLGKHSDVSAFIQAFADVVGDKYLDKNKSSGNAISELVQSPMEGQKPCQAVISGLIEGYYLITDDTSPLADGDAASRYIIEVLADATVNEKTERPDIDKKLYVTGDTEGDANTAGIGDHVSYVITGEVPDYTGYDYYYYYVEDTLVQGLTFDNNITVTLKKDGKVLRTLQSCAVGADDGTWKDDGDYYVVINGTWDPNKVPEGPTTFTIYFADIMRYEIGSEIEITYSATLNEKAKVGNTGNENKAHLNYSNDPKQEYKAGQDKDHPGKPLDETKLPIGKGAEHRTLTYTTELNVYKTQDGGTALPGAEFTLTGTSYEVVLENVTYYELLPFGKEPEGDDTVFYKLVDGKYTSNPPTKTDYKRIGMGDAKTKEGYLKDSDGNFYIPSNTDEYIGKDVYRLVKNNEASYADVNARYVEKKATTTTRVAVPVSITQTSDENGNLSFGPLGEGTYTLTETVTPEGFNTAQPLTLVITGKVVEKVETGAKEIAWSVGGGTSTDANGKFVFTVDKDRYEGCYYTNVINKSGSTLPSTGGMGTTILYIVGGILVLGAAVMLISRKRARGQQ